MGRKLGSGRREGEGEGELGGRFEEKERRRRENVRREWPCWGV